MTSHIVKDIGQKLADDISDIMRRNILLVRDEEETAAFVVASPEDHRCGSAASVEACIAEIHAWEDEQ